MRRQIDRLLRVRKAACRIYAASGVRGLVRRALIHIRMAPEAKTDLANYSAWCQKADAKLKREAPLAQVLRDSDMSPVLSVIVPTFNTPPGWLAEAIESVRNQSYGRWELCIADDASTNQDTRALLQYYREIDRRIKVIFRETNGHISEASNSAVELASGEFLVLLDHDDRLHPMALELVALAILNNPAASIIFSDEDKLNEQGVRTCPYFKSEFNYELLLSHNLISHLGVYRRSLVKAVGGFRPEFVGSQDYDLALRCLEHINFSEVIHIPHVLYHWRIHDSGTAKSGDAKPYAQGAAARAVVQHLSRCGIPVKVENNAEANGMHRLRFELQSPPPIVEIVLVDWTGVQSDYKTLKEIVEATAYPQLRITYLCLASTNLSGTDTAGISVPLSVHRHNSNESLISALNASAVATSADYICFLDLALRPLTPSWLDEMVAQGSREGIGCVGARLWGPNDLLVHAGIVIGLNGDAGFLHEKLPRHHPGYLGRAVLLQEFSAVSISCMLVRRSEFLAESGFDTNYVGPLTGVDFCLRQRLHSGLRTIWTPHAELQYEPVGDLPQDKRQAEWNADDRKRFQAKWSPHGYKDPAYSPNFSNETPGFRLA